MDRHCLPVDAFVPWVDQGYDWNLMIATPGSVLHRMSGDDVTSILPEGQLNSGQGGFGVYIIGLSNQLAQLTL